MTAGLALWTGVSLFTGTACWFQSVVGLPCPGCGTTRAVLALLEGRVGEALRWHPLIFVSLLLVPAYAILRHGPLKTRKKALDSAAISVFILYLAVYALRMILLFPHTEPMVPLKTAVWRQILGFFK